MLPLRKYKNKRPKKSSNYRKILTNSRTSFSAKVKERNDTETGLNRTKPPDELEERYETLKRRIEKAQHIINDENASPSEKQAAAERIAEDTGEMERLAPQMQQREEALPLRERVKKILKKYGWTLQAVVLATGLVLGAVALAAINGVKAGTQAVGKGLKTIGQKLGSLLPGLIGSIVSFIFRWLDRFSPSSESTLGC